MCWVEGNSPACVTRRVCGSFTVAPRGSARRVRRQVCAWEPVGLQVCVCLCVWMPSEPAVWRKRGFQSRLTDQLPNSNSEKFPQSAANTHLTD